MLFHHLLAIDDVDAVRQLREDSLLRQAYTGDGVDAVECAGLVGGYLVAGDIFDSCYVDTTESFGNAGIGVFAVVVECPDAHRGVSAPTTVCGRVGGTPEADAGLLGGRNDFEVFLLSTQPCWRDNDNLQLHS